MESALLCSFLFHSTGKDIPRRYMRAFLWLAPLYYAHLDGIRCGRYACPASTAIHNGHIFYSRRENGLSLHSSHTLRCVSKCSIRCRSSMSKIVDRMHLSQNRGNEPLRLVFVSYEGIVSFFVSDRPQFHTVAAGMRSGTRRPRTNHFPGRC